MPKEEEVVVEEEDDDEEEDKNDDDEDDEIETESPTLSPTHEPSHSSETPTESVLSEMIQATSSSSSSVSSSKNEESIQKMQKKPLNGDLPLDEFSMKLYFSVSSLTSDINYNDFEEVMSWYLEEYFNAHWESVLVEPIISSGLSSQLELDDGSLSLVKKYFDALESFSIEYVDLDLTSFSTSRETTRNRRGLRNNSAQVGRKLPVNKVVTTSFDGKVIVKSKKLDELEDEEDPEKYKEDRELLENVLLILEEQVIHLQKKAFSEAEEIPIATYIRVETGGSNEILTDVESVKVSFPGDEIIDEESNNDNNNNGGNGEGLPATGINAGSSSNSEDESKKDVIVRIVTALLTGIGGALIVAIIYAFIKRRKKRKNPKTRNDGTADLTDDMRSTINLKHKIRNNNDDDFDDLSSIGMGTAIFTSPKSVITAYTNIHQDRNNNNDDMSQVSFGYSVDGHSLATKQMPKYAKPDDDDDDDDDDSYLFDSNPVRNAVKTKAKEAREQQQQQRRALNQSNNNSKARNSRSLSRVSARTRDDGSVWTFSHMGMGGEDSILEEGFEICETNNHHNNGDLASSLDEMLLEGSVGGATNATGSTLNGLSTHYSLNRGRSFGDRSIVSNITCDDEDQHHINLQQHQKKHLVLPDIRNNVSQDTVAHKNHSTTTTSKTTTRINAASQQQPKPEPAAEINSFSYLSAPKALVKTISALSSEPGQIITTGRKQQSQWSLSNFMSATTNNNNNMGRRCDDTVSDAPSDEFTIQSPAKLSNNDHLVDEDQWNTYDQPADNDANTGISRVDSRFDQDSILEDLAVLDRSLKGKKKKAGVSFKRRFG